MTRGSRRVGPKPSPANRGERRSLGLKVTPTTKNLLDLAAKENGRTQSQEAEARLERSFQLTTVKDALELTYGREIAGVLLTLAREFVKQGRIGAAVAAQSRGSDPNEKSWWEDPHAYDRAARGANAIIEAFRPTGTPISDLNMVAAFSVGITLAAIKNPHWGEKFPFEHRNWDLEHFAEQMREMLGPELVARIPDPNEKEPTK
jgi:TraY domain